MEQGEKAAKLRKKERDLRERVEALDEELRKVMLEETLRLSAGSDDFPGTFSTSVGSFVPEGEYSDVRREIIDHARKTDEYQTVLAEFNEARSALDDVYYDIVSLAPDDSTYKEKMRVFYETIRRDKRGIHEYIGCVPQYAHRFYWNEKREQFCEKEWSKKRKDAQVTSPRRTRFLEEHDYICAKCGKQDEDEIVVHHIETVVNDDGTAEDKNLAPLCNSCHNVVHGGDPSSGEVIYESIEQFWAWANGNKRWKELIDEQTRLSSFYVFSQ